MKHTLDLMSDYDLVKLHQHNDSEATQSLLSRHQSLLLNLAKQHKSKYPFTSSEDNIQNATLGALQAYNRFKLENNTAQVSTFVYKTVYHYLLTCLDTESFVGVPSNLREIRSYIAGRYDNDSAKKNKFNKKYSINNEDDKQKLTQKYELIQTNPVGFYADVDPSFEDCVLDRADYENELISSVNNRMLLQSLDADDLLLLNKIFVEEESLARVAQFFSQKTGRKYTESSIKKRIHSIQATFA